MTISELWVQNSAFTQRPHRSSILQIANNVTVLCFQLQNSTSTSLSGLRACIQRVREKKKPCVSTAAHHHVCIWCFHGDGDGGSSSSPRNQIQETQPPIPAQNSHDGIEILTNPFHSHFPPLHPSPHHDLTPSVQTFTRFPNGARPFAQPCLGFNLLGIIQIGAPFLTSMCRVSESTGRKRGIRSSLFIPPPPKLQTLFWRGMNFMWWERKYLPRQIKSSSRE